MKNLINKLCERLNKSNDSIIDRIIACHGDYGLTYAYLNFFFPKIILIDNVPFLHFIDGKKPLPIDCFHIDLLHHFEAEIE